MADSQIMQQVLTNLLRSAVKYSSMKPRAFVWI